jgi:hypothetical protein
MMLIHTTKFNYLRNHAELDPTNSFCTFGILNSQLFISNGQNLTTLKFVIIMLIMKIHVDSLITIRIVKLILYVGEMLKSILLTIFQPSLYNE